MRATLVRLRTLSLFTALFVSACLATADPAPAVEPLWRPDRTWVFAVGVLEWEHSEMWGSFPQENRRDAELARFFHSGGVPADHIVYLADAKATLACIRTELAGLLARTRAGDFLLLYYAGHGDREEKTGAVYFANYDAQDAATGWSVREIAETVEASFQGARVLLSADCCHSGGLARAAEKTIHRAACACLTSSLARVESTGNWTFTECLLDGLRGERTVDLDGDGIVRLDELGGYALDRMSFLEDQLVSYRRFGGFRGDLSVATAHGAQVAQLARVEVLWEGQWWKAMVLAREGDRCRIRYAGHGVDDDEWVGPERMRPYLERHRSPGTSVEVEWKKSWYPARVLEASHGLHRVRYDGYGEEWDEWVGPRRIRPGGK